MAISAYFFPHTPPTILPLCWFSLPNKLSKPDATDVREFRGCFQTFWRSSLFFLSYLGVIFSLTALTCWYKRVVGKTLGSWVEIFPETVPLAVWSFLQEEGRKRCLRWSRLLINVCKVILCPNRQCVWGHLAPVWLRLRETVKSLPGHTIFLHRTAFLPWKSDRQTVAVEVGNLRNSSPQKKKKKKWVDWVSYVREDNSRCLVLAIKTKPLHHN